MLLYLNSDGHFCCQNVAGSKRPVGGNAGFLNELCMTLLSHKPMAEKATKRQHGDGNR